MKTSYISKMELLDIFRSKQLSNKVAKLFPMILCWLPPVNNVISYTDSSFFHKYMYLLFKKVQKMEG